MELKEHKYNREKRDASESFMIELSYKQCHQIIISELSSILFYTDNDNTISLKILNDKVVKDLDQAVKKNLLVTYLAISYNNDAKVCALYDWQNLGTTRFMFIFKSCVYIGKGMFVCNDIEKIDIWLPERLVEQGKKYTPFNLFEKIDAQNDSRDIQNFAFLTKDNYNKGVKILMQTFTHPDLIQIQNVNFSNFFQDISYTKIKKMKKKKIILNDFLNEVNKCILEQ